MDHAVSPATPARRAASAIAGRLAGVTLELIDIASVSGDEDAISEFVAARLRGAGLAVHTDGDGVVGMPPPSQRPLLVLAGHLDTVPEQGNLPGWADDQVVHGLGASDMKGSVAVMLELVDELYMGTGAPSRRLDVAVLLVRREELPVALSGTPRLLAAHPRLTRAALVLVMEPTGNAVELGCMGNLTVDAVWYGRAAHSARPWQGANAAHRALRALIPVAGGGVDTIDVGGLEYSRVTSVVRLEAGIADNVIPDRAMARINHRYPPGVAPGEAERELTRMLGADAVEVVSHAPSGAVCPDNPELLRLEALGARPRRAKQAWTPVAEFTAAGVDAVNFGPGDGAAAHQRDESVGIASLVRSLELLRALVVADGPEGEEG